jgi:hypothetical protein
MCKHLGQVPVSFLPYFGACPEEANSDLASPPTPF